MFKIVRLLKNTLVHIRRTFKFTFLILIGLAIICFLILFVYKPIYSVTLNDEFIGYSEDKSKLQERINNYMANGDNETVAFVEIQKMPQYKMCLLKKGNETNDDEIFNKVIESGVSYYKYYAILDSGVEKYYVKTYEECEQIIAGLKEKNSNNINSISYAVKYETNLNEFVDSRNSNC